MPLRECLTTLEVNRFNLPAANHQTLYGPVGRVLNLSGIADRLDFRVERDDAFSDDANVVAEALSDDVEMPAHSDPILSNFLTERGFHSTNFRRKARVDFEHSGVDFEHSGVDFEHSGVNLAHSGVNLAHSGVNLAHSGVNLTHSGVDISNVCANHSEFFFDRGIHIGSQERRLPSLSANYVPCVPRGRRLSTWQK